MLTVLGALVLLTALLSVTGLIALTLVHLWNYFLSDAFEAPRADFEVVWLSTTAIVILALLGAYFATRGAL